MTATPTPETEYDPAVYDLSTGYWACDDSLPEGGRFVPQTWRQLAEERAAELSRLRDFQTMVLDLDRNEHGRHEGDADVGDPSGVSIGNPHIRPGQVFAYSIAGDRRPYVMPERGRRHDPAAWVQDRR